MHWLTARQRVLAENVANLDTPQYQAQDLTPLDFGSQLSSVARSTGITIAGHSPSAPKLQPVMTASDDLPALASRQDDAPHVNKLREDHTINGNTTSMEDEMMKVSSTAADYQMMTELYQRQVNLFTTALDKGE